MGSAPEAPACPTVCTGLRQRSVVCHVPPCWAVAAQVFMHCWSRASQDQFLQLREQAQDARAASPPGVRSFRAGIPACGVFGMPWSSESRGQERSS